MRTINHEWLEFSNKLEHDIRNVGHDVMMLLAFRQPLRKDRVHRQDFMRVPEHLRHKGLSFGLGYHFVGA